MAVGETSCPIERIDNPSRRVARRNIQTGFFTQETKLGCEALQSPNDKLFGLLVSLWKERLKGEKKKKKTKQKQANQGDEISSTFELDKRVLLLTVLLPDLTKQIAGTTSCTNRGLEKKKKKRREKTGKTNTVLTFSAKSRSMRKKQTMWKCQMCAFCVFLLRFWQCPMHLCAQKALFSFVMASSSSHNNSNGISLATLLEWYKIRDTFFGDNEVSQNIPLALELASSCHHPDARWLTEACAGEDVNTEEDAKRVFSAFGENDARALFFTWLLGYRYTDLAPLRRSAELGFAFAQAWLAWRTRGEEKFMHAQMAASQGERDGFFWLGRCFRDGEGCQDDLDKAKENFVLASELSHVMAMSYLGDLFDESDPQRWRWWGRAAALFDCSSFLFNFVKQVDLFNSGSGSAAVMFVIGQALQGHVNEEARTIFNNDGFKFDSLVGPSKQAIAFYKGQIKATKDAMRAWTLVGIHFNVVKDVRKLIAKLIWDSREEALFVL
jgi:hypothetical protein